MLDQMAKLAARFEYEPKSEVKLTKAEKAATAAEAAAAELVSNPEKIMSLKEFQIKERKIVRMLAQLPGGQSSVKAYEVGLYSQAP